MSLKKIENAMKKPKHAPINKKDPIAELKMLVQQHRALVRAATSIGQMVEDKTARIDIPARGLKAGDKIKTVFPAPAVDAAQALASSYREQAAKLESAMIRELKKVPIYNMFLANVFGVGAVVAAYLVSEVDIHKARNPSSLRQFCGMGVTKDGHLSRRMRGQKNSYHAELRTRLYQMFSSIWKNSARVSADAPFGKTSKYLEIWTGYKHRVLHSERVDAKGRIVNAQGKTVSAKGFAHSTGWHKAADVFLTDLYLVWRALEGLPVRCPYVAEKLGYWHGALPAWEGMRDITVDEALALVGEVGGVPRARPDSSGANDDGEEHVGAAE